MQTITASNSMPPEPVAMQYNTGPRMRLSAIARQQWADSARREGNDNGLWVSTTSKWFSINLRFSQCQVSSHALEIDLHDLWFMYYHASKNISHDNPALDRLAFQVMQAREQGALSRQSSGPHAIERAVTSGGIIWTDLPFLVSDMTEFWIKDCAVMDAAQRLNFATFLAKLASVGLASDKLCSIALIVLRDTLETPRPLGKLVNPSEEDPDRSLHDLSVGELLPAANVWLFQTGVKLIQLSDQQWNDCSNDIGHIGDLCRDDTSGFVNATSAGFSPGRWVFWLRRLEEIVQEASNAGDDSLAEYASRVMDNMLLIVDQRDSSVKRQLEASPGVVRHQPVAQEIGPGLH